MNWTNVIQNLLILFSLPALAVSLLVTVQKIRQDSADFHNRLSLLAVLFVAVAVVLWPVVRAYAPPLPVPTDANYAESLNRARRYLQVWRWVGFSLCSLGVASSLLGRVRFSPVIILSAAGTALFWRISTMFVRA